MYKIHFIILHLCINIIITPYLYGLPLEQLSLIDEKRSIQTRAAYSVILTTSNPAYQRPYELSKNYYYDKKQLTVSQNGYYMFISTGDVTPMQHMYKNGFDSANPNAYFMAQSTSTYSSTRKTNLTVYLEASSRKKRQVSSTSYYLITTTDNPGVTGTITFDINGPGTVRFINSSTTTTITTTTISSNNDITTTTTTTSGSSGGNSDSSSTSNLGTILGSVLGGTCAIVSAVGAGIALCLTKLKHRHQSKHNANSRSKVPIIRHVYDVQQNGGSNHVQFGKRMNPPVIPRPYFTPIIARAPRLR